MGWRQVGKPKITKSVHNFPLPPVAVDPLSSPICNPQFVWLCHPGRLQLREHHFSLLSAEPQSHPDPAVWEIQLSFPSGTLGCWDEGGCGGPCKQHKGISHGEPRKVAAHLPGSGCGHCTRQGFAGEV